MSVSPIQVIVHAGFREDLPSRLKKKVKATNIIALLTMFAIALPFIIISWVYFPDLTIIPVVGALASVGVIIANILGGIYYSRLVLSLLPITLGALYNAYLCEGTETPIPGIFLIELSFSLVPFLLFDLREKGFLWLSSLYCIALICGFPVTKEWVHLNTDDAILRSGWLGNFSVLLGVMTGLCCMGGLGFLNLRESEESDRLLKETVEKNKTMEKSQQALQDTVAQLEVAQGNERKRNWVTEGIARITDIFRTQSNADDVFDQILAQLIRYLNANQGGIYVVNGREENEAVTIQMAACYAYARKKYLNQSFQVGEGLIGQCYLEEDAIYLTDIPSNYVRITSGLGEAAPTALLLMPLKVNDVVEGIVEIASFRPLEAHEVEYVSKAGENIASYIQGHRINERTNRLLEDTQLQAEQMRAQEEEMRQNMEELAATQEEMHRKEREYVRQIEELKNLILEGDRLAAEGQ